MKLPNTFSVFPVEGKKPLVDWKEFSQRPHTYDERMEWDYKFTNYNLGIATGAVSRILVLDDDGGLDVTKYPVPKTLTQTTPRGGKHYFFKWTKELESKVTTKVGILEKVDVRGAGGFICFYGFDKPYHLVPIALPPKWLVDLLPSRSQIANNSSQIANKENDWMLKELEAIKPGEGNSGRTPTFVRIINKLKREGLSEGSVIALLTPWAEKYDYHKLEKIVIDQYKRYPVRQQSQDAETSNSLLDFLVDSKEINYVVPNLIAENTINILAGLQESRKSWELLDLAVAIASGTPWLGKFKVERKKVLIIDQERPKLEMQRRIKALVAGRGLSIEDLEGQLVPKAGTTMRINLDQSYEKLCRLIEEIHPEVILIDSLKTFQTGVITDNQSMQEVFERIKQLRLKYNLTFVILHHENKMAYLRSREGMEITAENVAGASSIAEVPEGIFISVNQNAEASIMHHVKNSYGIKQPPFFVRIVDLNEDKSKIVVEAY